MCFRFSTASYEKEKHMKNSSGSTSHIDYTGKHLVCKGIRTVAHCGVQIHRRIIHFPLFAASFHINYNCY